MIDSSWIAMLCFAVEFCSRSLAQYGFLLQKQAHRNLELEKTKVVKTDGNNNQVDLDKVNIKRTYCSPRWIIGCGLVIINVAVHALVLPFVDLTLLACNACTAIIVNMILSTRLLGERFIWQYDVTAMILIAIGSISIVLNANTE